MTCNVVIYRRIQAERAIENNVMVQYLVKFLSNQITLRPGCLDNSQLTVHPDTAEYLNVPWYLR